MRFAYLVSALGALGACFHPSYDRPACGPEGQCPDGFACSASQICEPGLPGGTDDARVFLDAPNAPDDGAPLDGKAPAVCLGTFVNVCVDPPTGNLALTGSLDTDSSNLCAPYTSTPAVDACVVAGVSINVVVGTGVRVTGKKKLILLATDTITIAGTLDGSSDATTTGPSATLNPCKASVSPTTQVQGGGGAGGSFQLGGGNGGNTGGGGKGGLAATPTTFAQLALRGGCGGDTGAKGAMAGNLGAVGGVGGGALALIARQLVSITGVVNASGAGGKPGTAAVGGGGGGGGGGSGGMILLDADSVVVQAGARCFANGGGGSEGSGQSAGGAGGTSTGPATSAPGGSGSSTGGDGGSGASNAGTSGTGAAGIGNGNNSGGGGGGGGDYGFVVIVGANRQYNVDAVSPTPNTLKP